MFTDLTDHINVILDIKYIGSKKRFSYFLSLSC